MHIFYIPEISGEIINLNPQESRHAVKVLRLEKGSVVRVVDGKGGLYIAEIINPDFKNCCLKITDSTKEYGKKNFYLHIGIAPTKNIDRFEWFLEKAAEIGIDEITPLLSDHSERKKINPERLEKILISAIKQSVKAYKPKLNKLTKFNDLVNSCQHSNKFIAHCQEGQKPHFKDVIQPGSEISILIGPEGDFNPDEIQKATDKGFKSVSLGSSRLRTETAGVIACHIVNLANTT
ncbi:MAG: 16S rRNA (uracil(1498)-N(3))-methyltransferase [Prolixibacteraceae bacterium]|jgi:16S rRNA (uracil1498-N3)-methyltransferase|nr:16S rRNA (uracil(1498)-N(3))-methyltransferase [Prolixibacteraceae bacterium]